MMNISRAKSAMAHLGQALVGVAQDFWKDGTEIPFRKDRPAYMPATPIDEVPRGEWHAVPGEIAERLWGKNCILPGDEALGNLMANSLSLTREITVLDLSAGLGNRMQQMHEVSGATVTGLESDPQIAARGMEMQVQAGGKAGAISPYDPASLSVAHKYDRIVAREIFYRTENKSAFLEAIAQCANPEAQIAFTDYILNPEDRDNAAVKSWQASETGSAPLGLVEMAEAWAQAGFHLDVLEDQTEFYRKEILLGLKHLAQFLASGVHPDGETKKALQSQLAQWTHRITALENGLKFYRFHGVKKS